MLRHIRFAVIAAVALWMQVISAYAPTNTKQIHISRVGRFRPANFVHAAAPTHSSTPFVWLRMSSEEEGSKSKVSTDGTFYDDEVSSSCRMVRGNHVLPS